jgi:hypothetical protein
MKRFTIILIALATVVLISSCKTSAGHCDAYGMNDNQENTTNS